VIYANALTFEDARDYYQDMKARAKAWGRNPDDLKVMPGITPYIGRTMEEAQAKFQALQDLIDPLIGLGALYPFFGDLTHLDVDGPVPPPREDASIKSMAENLYDLAQTEGMSIRQLYQQTVSANGQRYMIGTPESIADDMQAWLEGGAADGFNICPPAMPDSLDDFVELLLPELRRRKLVRESYEGATFRENLGLSAPQFGDIRARPYKERAAREAAKAAG